MSNIKLLFGFISIETLFKEKYIDTVDFLYFKNPVIDI